MGAHPSLRVSYRKGRAVAAYLYLKEPRPGAAKTTQEVRAGILIDLGADGEPIGIEFLSPGAVTAEDLRAIQPYLRTVRSPARELAPILAA